MKKRIVYISILIMIFMVSGCTSEETISELENNQNEDEEAIIVNDDSTKGEEEMEFVFMTKEEFIYYIENNDVGVTEKDFDGIDIDDFIARNYLNEDNILRIKLDVAIEDYLKELESERLSTYLAHGIVSVDSTEEEYTDFRNRFILSITDGQIITSGKEIDLIDWYRVSYENSDGKIMTEYMWIGQTKHLDKFEIRNEDGIFLIQIPWDSSGFGYEAGFFYNKNQKYFYTGGKFDWGIQFTEME